MKVVEPNSFVTVDYILKDDDGDVLDASTVEESGPIEYVHGYGMLVPGLEAALAGMKPGERKKIKVSADEGYGERDEELMLEIERSEFPKGVKPGDEFVASSPDGEEVVLQVVEVNEDSVLVDANHPLAGMTLHYEVEVKKLRAATEKEVEEAARAMDDAHDHVHGEGCDHDHDHSHANGHGHAHGGHAHGHEKVVPLGKKPKDDRSGKSTSGTGDKSAKSEKKK